MEADQIKLNCFTFTSGGACTQAITVGQLIPGNLTMCTNHCMIKYVHLNLQPPFLLNSPLSLEICPFKLSRHLAVSLFYLDEQ